MITYMFNGECDRNIKQAFIDAYKQANDKLRLVVETTSDYKKSGIYSATRDDTSKPVVIDWGDGTVEQVNGDVSQKVHEYSSIGTFNAVIENIKSYAASAEDTTWRYTTSQNSYTLKEVVVMPVSVTSIGKLAFYNCSGLTSITIGNGVTSIGSGAFEDCGGLTSVTIPSRVTSIGNGAFHMCSNLMSISVSSGNANYKSVNGLLLSKDGKTLIAGVNGDVVIPDNVTSIDYGAFYFCSRLTSVMIPDSMTSIGGSAFYGCSKLTSVTIPDSVTNIGNNAFQNCSGLMSVTIPDSVTSIGEALFSGCSKLTSVIIPNSVMNIGRNAFSGCSRLTNMTIPESVTSIGEQAFNNCSSLTSVTIPNSVTSIGNKVFNKCSKLMTINIDKTVAYVQAMTNYSWGLPSGCTITCTDGSIVI